MRSVRRHVVTVVFIAIYAVVGVAEAMRHWSVPTRPNHQIMSAATTKSLRQADPGPSWTQQKRPSWILRGESHAEFLLTKFALPAAEGDRCFLIFSHVRSRFPVSIEPYATRAPPLA